MTEQRLFPKPHSARDITPFSSARQAWFWFVRCQTARIEGARVVADAGEVVRPCDPDDVYNAVMRLKRRVFWATGICRYWNISGWSNANPMSVTRAKRTRVIYGNRPLMRLKMCWSHAASSNAGKMKVSITKMSLLNWVGICRHAGCKQRSHTSQNR